MVIQLQAASTDHALRFDKFYDKLIKDDLASNALSECSVICLLC